MGILNAGLSYWQADIDGEPLIEATIGDLLDRCAAQFPAKEAVVYAGYPELGEAFNIRWTYQEYRERVDAVARGLLTLGLKKGEHIALWATNIPEWPLLFLAAVKVGLVVVTINPVLLATELAYILRQGDVCALFFMDHMRDHDCLATMRTLTTPGDRNGEVKSEQLPSLSYISLLGSPPAGLLEQESWRPTLLDELVSAGRQVSEETLASRQASVKPLDAALMMYTSGTTGFPKGVILSHRSISNQSSLVMHRGGFHEDDRVCIAIPFFHVFGNSFVVGTLCTGTTLYPLLSFSPLKVLQVISQEHCTRTAFVPTMLIALLQHPQFSAYDLTSLRYISNAGAPVPVSLMERVKERIGANIGIAFGQTESSGPITSSRHADPFELKAVTVGQPMLHTDVKIIDPATGEVVLCDQAGEICCRGFQVMQGYYKMPERTAEAIDAEGWLHTGDLATMDARGYVKIVGRLKETVIRGGENIFPREIEEFLLRHPKIADVHVLGVPDAFFGEVLLAVVQIKENEQLSEEEIRAFCTGQISHQKIPRYIQFVDSYPMTASGKVQKHVLRERAIKELALEEFGQTKTV